MAGTSLKYQCSYCLEDIASVRVKCAECIDFDLCLQCFSCGAEIGKHRNKHKYFFVDCGNLPVFQPPHAWSAKEETLLLGAVEEYGYGNWEEVAQSVGNNRTAEEVTNHYNEIFVIGNIGQATWTTENRLNIKDHTMPETGPLSPSLTTTLSPIELSSQEQQELGYLPNRDDFEKEYDNEAESLVSNLVFVNEDDDIDIALKLAQVNMYSRRVSERLRKKKIVKEHGLVNNFFNSSSKQKTPVSKKKLSKEEKEFQEKMQVFCRFHTATEHEQMFENLQKEKDLKARIKELIRYRRNGITKSDDCADFDSGKYKQDKKNKKKSGTSGSSRKKSSTASKGRDEKGSSSSLEENGGDDNKKKSKQVIISALPEYKLLSVQEKKLCSSLKLKPSYYITFKTTLLKADLRKKQGKTVKSRYPAGLEKSDCLKIVDFMVSSGWITAVSL